jgi:prephenate dehydratase
MKISALGPEGTYSDQAARQYYPEDELILAGSIKDAIDKVSTGDCQRGVVPIENSIQGIVTVTFDELFDRNLLIRGEEVLDIYHTLAGVQLPESHDDIRKIYSHSQALAQCRRYFAKQYPEAEFVETASTAGGMKTIAAEQDKTALAVGPGLAAELYGLVKVDEEIEDEPGNQTRFVAFSKDTTPDKEQDFIMVAVVPDGDRPGLIHDITGVIDELGINLSDLHSRPMRNRLGSYKFYMRLDMKSGDDRYAELAAEIEAHGNQVVRMST